MAVAMFAGQGSHHPGLAAFVDEWRPGLRSRAAEVAGGDPFLRVSEGTRWTQPAVFCASLALWEKARREGVDGGHSLGEIAALVVAGVIDEFDALGLVCCAGG